ncbi:MAG: penicillin-binding protein 2 [Verrucomicrobia bacterium]|nr:MAG: penicillin-binding protein 2 [Verrucomicrobiota bacterium]PYK95320.1 MAG: penicillin-binding protein 2 [Verrucomicrobiota bacterium]PYL57478.1 MAG: penicillin-binding protein 2 [Verrucomicrobiota bacterium]
MRKKCIASCSGISYPQIRQVLAEIQVGTFFSRKGGIRRKSRMALRAIPGCLLAIFVAQAELAAQSLQSSATQTASPTAEEETIIPTFETQKLARTYVLDVPAPRGQITDRHGAPLAQNKLNYNLAINFPTPLDFSDAQALGFVREQIDKAEKLIGRPIKISDETILRHYRNRGILPFEIAQNLTQSEYDEVNEHLPAAMVVRPIYVRVYPNGKLAGQIIGYTGKTGRNLDGIIDNHETLWPETEGREGLEQAFNEMLLGKHGEYKLTFDKDGRKTSEKLITPPVPGYNVVTTLDLRLQELAEKALEAKAKRGAIVIVDPNTGDILAMASWPTYDPNSFVPSISAEKFKALQDDPDIPLLPRAFRSSYPPGSTFKIAVGIAALETGAVGPEDRYECLPAIEIGNLTFHNWKKGDRGALNFVQALTESCDTWFYQVGIKTGAEPIIDWAIKLGFGAKCGIPLRGEAEGRVPNDEYMKATHSRRLLNGDIANLSIGQGDTQVTPLQMAQAMAIVANGGTFYQARLVQQVQTLDDEIVTAYQVRAKRTLDLSPGTLDELRTGMIDAVNGAGGTGHAASLDNVEVAGKTGTAQWGPKNKERTAAWFGGFLPANQPQYAFAALYEGDVGSKVHGGSASAPMIAQVFKDLYSGQRSTGRRRATEQMQEGNIPRALPVEEDESD